MSERTSGVTEEQMFDAFRRHELWELADRDQREIIEIDGYGWAGLIVPPDKCIIDRAHLKRLRSYSEEDVVFLYKPFFDQIDALIAGDA